jgi:hypothetical protein
MFELIKNQVSGINATESLKEIEPLKKIKERRLNRLSAIEELILSLGQPLDYLLPSINALMLPDPYDMLPGVQGSKFLLPALCLLDNEELPSHLRITDPLDPRLNDPVWFDQFGLWLEEHLGTKAKKPNFLQRESFRLYIKFLQDPDKASKAIQFILGHELGHVVYRHKDPWSFLFEKTALVSASVLGMVISSSLRSKEESIQTIICKVSFGGLVGMTSLIGFRILKFLRENKSREMQMDQFSFKINSNASEGAIYLFDLLKKHYQGVKKNLSQTLNWREYLVSHLLINSDGELRIFNWTHGSFLERMEEAKKYSSHGLSKPKLVSFLINLYKLFLGKT